MYLNNFQSIYFKTLLICYKIVLDMMVVNNLKGQEYEKNSTRIICYNNT